MRATRGSGRRVPLLVAAVLLVGGCGTPQTPRHVGLAPHPPQEAVRASDTVPAPAGLVSTGTLTLTPAWARRAPSTGLPAAVVGVAQKTTGPSS